MVFCNGDLGGDNDHEEVVTILILIDGFLQYNSQKERPAVYSSHNPYFNRWFSAIREIEDSGLRYDCHNPYFNRWFSAIGKGITIIDTRKSHNPYFNRWFSAIGFYSWLSP